MKRYRTAAAPGRKPRDVGLKPSEGISDETMMDFTMDELREFLEADHLDVPVDPAFKERLRQRLWNLVLSRARRPTGSDRDI